MVELYDVMRMLGEEPYKRSKITKDEIPTIALAVAVIKYMDMCAWYLDAYNEKIEEGISDEELDKWMEECVRNGRYPVFTKLYTDANLDSRHSWDGWLTERKFGYGAVQSMGERGPEMLNITQPKEEEKKKHWWSRK